MAGTYTYPTWISQAEATTGFSVDRGSALAQGSAPQGTNYILQYLASSASGQFWVEFDNTTGLNFSTNDYYLFLFAFPLNSQRQSNKDATNPGGQIEMRSTTSNYKRWNIVGNDTLIANDYRDGFEFLCIDPNSTADQSAGTLNQASIRYFSVRAYFATNASGSRNAIDAISYGRGITCTGGGSVGTPLNFTDISDDCATQGRRHVTEKGAVVEVLGDLKFDSTASDIHFNAEGYIISFIEARGALDNERAIYNSNNPPRIIIDESGANDTNWVLGDETSEVGGGVIASDATRIVFEVAGALNKCKFLGVLFVDIDWDFDSAANHQSKNCLFDNCEEYILGTRTFEGNTVSNASSGVLMTSSHISKNNTYIGLTDAIHVSDNGPVTVILDRDMFSGNTDDIHFSGTGTLTIKNTNGADASSSRVSGGGTVVIENIITIRVTFEDEAGDPIEGVSVLLEKSIGGDDVLTGTTNASGVLEDTDYDFPGASFGVTGYGRLHTSSPYYRESALSGEVTSSGYDVTVVMISDE